MANADYPFGVLEVAEVQTAAPPLGIDVANFEIRRAEDIAPAFEALKGRANVIGVFRRITGSGNSENSKANRIETMNGPAESGQICSVGRRKIAKKIAKNKR